MAKLVWRFQADVAKGETDPLVTVFMGAERVVMDDNGEPTSETFIQQDQRDPITMPLSELADALANPASMAAQKKKSDAARAALFRPQSPEEPAA